MPRSLRRPALRGIIPYVVLIFFLTLVSGSVRELLVLDPEFVAGVDFRLFVVAGLLFVAYFINCLAPKTVIPSFVWALFAGLALQPALSFFTEDIEGLKIVIEVFGAIVLFAGGLEIPFKNFQKWFFPIASLSLIGVLASSVLFAFGLYYMMQAVFGYETALLPSIVILSAALASTDPTAIIPTMNAMRFKRGHLKQIAIAESALTDVSGSIVTRFLLLALISSSAVSGGSLLRYFEPLLQKSSYDAMALQIISGIFVGYVGYWLLKKFYSGKAGENQTDPALLLAVPVFTFALGNVLGGAGFLAAFVSGLLSDIGGGVKKAHHFYDSFLNHLIKPFIFMMLGALVPLPTLLRLAPLGVAAAAVFMFVVRPIVVFISLLPWLWNATFTFRELMFLSFIRETGIIAAVLLIVASTHKVIVSDFLLAIGMWVILLTLVIEPPLTPAVAKVAGVAEAD